MKKALNIISIFILMISFVYGAFFTNNNTVVKAAAPETAKFYFSDNAYNHEREGYKVPVNNIQEDLVIEYKGISGTSYGTITISKQGVVTLVYDYGYTELLVVAQKCANPIDEGDGLFECTVWGEKRDLFFIGGAYNKRHSKNNNVTSSPGKQSVNLYPTFNYNDIVRVSVITEIAQAPNPANSKSGDERYNYNKIDTDSDYYTGFYKPMYCRIGVSAPNCHYYDAKIYEKYASEFDPYRRAPVFAKEKEFSNYEIHNISGAIIFQGYENTDPPNFVKDNPFDTNNDYSVQNVIVRVDNAAVEKSEEEVMTIVYDTVIPTLLAVVTLLALVTCTVLGYKIVKSSDEPQERQEKISRLKGILIGIAIAYVVLFAFEPLVELVKGLLE